MEPRRLERLVFLLCCCAAITCSLHAGAQAQPTLRQQSEGSPHNGAVGRVLSETANRSHSDLSRRTRRIDPLDGLRKYEGGFNITDKHYWSSTVFTGRSGYIIGALWLIGGIIFAGFLLAWKIFFAKSNERERDGAIDDFLDRCHLVSVMLIILLAVFAIVASAIALQGAVRFHSRAESIKDIVGRTALEATATIYNITGAIERMQNISKLYNISSQSFDHLNSTVKALNSEAVEIQAKAKKNMRLVIIFRELVIILTVTLNLVVVLVLLVGRPLRLQKLYYMCIALCWVLTVLFWMYFGLYYFLDKFAGDTCAALEEYQLNPKNSTLGAIIPCSEKMSGSVILHDVGAGIHDIIDQVNSNIYAIKSEYTVKQLDYICNPFAGPPAYRYRPENCPSGAATIGDIPQILRRLTCSELGGGANCAPAELSSAIDYDKVQTYTSSIQNVLDIFPGTERLVQSRPSIVAVGLSFGQDRIRSLGVSVKLRGMRYLTGESAGSKVKMSESVNLNVYYGADNVRYNELGVDLSEFKNGVTTLVDPDRLDIRQLKYWLTTSFGLDPEEENTVQLHMGHEPGQGSEVANEIVLSGSQPQDVDASQPEKESANVPHNVCGPDTGQSSQSIILAGSGFADGDEEGDEMQRVMEEEDEDGLV
ncbi:hypothetical protein TRIUR3_18766 [Triticum urartu]|uniref:Uncharacterized protein n=1 Tax=Triticum urartu TaxID=4572 RepID=M7ZBB7_TRIUA|nr:hypothetical protein TRIUR3_18766 [Triticum urartu]